MKDLEAKGLTVYCLFNNTSMGNDAEWLTHLIKLKAIKQMIGHRKSLEVNQ